jgi:hypothetical protein
MSRIVRFRWRKPYCFLWSMQSGTRIFLSCVPLISNRGCIMLSWLSLCAVSCLAKTKRNAVNRNACDSRR